MLAQRLSQCQWARAGRRFAHREMIGVSSRCVESRSEKPIPRADFPPPRCSAAQKPIVSALSITDGGYKSDYRNITNVIFLPSSPTFMARRRHRWLLLAEPRWNSSFQTDTNERKKNEMDRRIGLPSYESVKTIPSSLRVGKLERVYDLMIIETSRGIVSYIYLNEPFDKRVCSRRLVAAT